MSSHLDSIVYTGNGCRLNQVTIQACNGPTSHQLHTRADPTNALAVVSHGPNVPGTVGAVGSMVHWVACKDTGCMSCNATGSRSWSCVLGLTGQSRLLPTPSVFKHHIMQCSIISCSAASHGVCTGCAQQACHVGLHWFCVHQCEGRTCVHRLETRWSSANCRIVDMHTQETCGWQQQGSQQLTSVCDKVVAIVVINIAVAVIVDAIVWYLSRIGPHVSPQICMQHCMLDSLLCITCSS